MYVLVSNVWFTKLMKQFFFWIDKIVFNFISVIYDVMISVARTSVFTQSDIVEMSDRIYKLLAIFMIFKVTLSLITYVVNPDDFSDKSKGVSKLGVNIVISMALLILTPYIFSYAYQFQTIILEDNSLGTLIFGGEEANESFFNTAGDKIAYITLTPFFSPNTAIDELNSCSTLIGDDKKFNKDCSGFNEDYSVDTNATKGMTKLLGSSDDFSESVIRNYVAGVENGNLGLMFRQDMAIAVYKPDGKSAEFIMEYKFIFSTVTGIIIILLLITFCMDIAVRSIKLAFLQLVAPIPIISYVDPKSGKDGLFKKWYEMCIKTYLSLFIRLIALYFAVFIISKVADLKLVDIVDGSYVNNGIISILIIIGALMFAKQLPKMLEGLGIKLDSGSFTLNPLRKMEKEALGGNLLKKPNDALAKFGKGVLKSPIAGASLGARKLMAGIDSASHGKGFWNGTKNVKSKLAQSKDKFLEKNLPHKNAALKKAKEGREEVALMNRNWTKGEEIYKKMDAHNFNDKSLDGLNTKAYNVAGFSGEFLQSKMKLDKETEKQKMLRQLNSAAATNPGGLKAAVKELTQDERKNLTKYFGENYINELENMSNTSFAKALDTQEKTVSGLEKVHESMRKQNGDQADIEDQLKFVKYNQIDPTDPGRHSILLKEEEKKETTPENETTEETSENKYASQSSYDERISYATDKMHELINNGASEEEIKKQVDVINQLEKGKKYSAQKDEEAKQLAEEADEYFNDGWMSQGRASNFFDDDN